MPALAFLCHSVYGTSDPSAANDANKEFAWFSCACQIKHIYFRSFVMFGWEWVTIERFLDSRNLFISKHLSKDLEMFRRIGNYVTIRNNYWLEMVIPSRLHATRCRYSVCPSKSHLIFVTFSLFDGIIVSSLKSVSSHTKSMLCDSPHATHININNHYKI